MASSVLLSTARRRKKVQLHHFRNNPSQAGLAIMSLDVLDYSVLHLSAYERSHRKFAGKLRSRASKEGDISPLVAMGRLLKERAAARHAHHTGASEVPEVYTMNIGKFAFTGTGGTQHHSAGTQRHPRTCKPTDTCALANPETPVHLQTFGSIGWMHGQCTGARKLPAKTAVGGWL